MIILGIETSCDETACAILQKDKDSIHILSNVVASSANLQAKYGGVIPEQAAREQLKCIVPVIEEALNQAFPKERLPRRYALPLSGTIARNDGVGIDAIAVTYGPGLIGSLLVGVETAKTLALVWDKPLIPVNHLIGHFYANWIIPSLSFRATSEESSTSKNHHSSSEDCHVPRQRRGPRNDDNESQTPAFPCLGLLVSGGHTDLVLFKNHGKYEYLGGTRDDAAGECFDKCARLLGLPYPGGPQISKLAEKGNPHAFNLPRPMLDSKDFDFSFSGLKTAAANIIHPSEKSKLAPKEVKYSLAASIEQAIVDVLVTKTITAAQTYKVDQIMIAGGVASNQKLTSDLKFKLFANLKFKIQLHIPPAYLCTDNAAMIAAAAFFQKPIANPLELQANPNLSLF